MPGIWTSISTRSDARPASGRGLPRRWTPCPPGRRQAATPRSAQAIAHRAQVVADQHGGHNAATSARSGHGLHSLVMRPIRGSPQPGSADGSAFEQRAHVRPGEPLVTQLLRQVAGDGEHGGPSEQRASARPPRCPRRRAAPRPALGPARPAVRRRGSRRGLRPGASVATPSPDPACSSATPWKSRPFGDVPRRSGRFRAAHRADAPRRDRVMRLLGEQRDLGAHPLRAGPAGATSRRRDPR